MVALHLACWISHFWIVCLPLVVYFLILVAYLFQQLPVKECMNSNCFDSFVWLSMAQFCPYTGLNIMWVLTPTLEILVLQNFTALYQCLQLPLKQLRSHSSFCFFLTYMCPISFSLEAVRILSLFPVFGNFLMCQRMVPFMLFICLFKNTTSWAGVG